jgi:alpha-galactosidase
MKAMTDYIHSLGLKCGIYSSPFLHAWGEPPFLPFIPGCTVGERDYRFSGMNTGIGVIHKEANCVRQWDAWGFDYLKYDWSPADPVNAEIMRQELSKASRDFGYCITVNALPEYWEYWSNYVNSYRCGTDSLGTWDNLMQIFDSYFKFCHCRNKGHYQDLDMLDVGTFKTHFVRTELTEDEAIIAYTVRAFFNSPIQISSTLEAAEGFEMDLYGNEEMIALNQDCAFSGAHPIFGIGNRFHVFEMQTEDGGYAYAVFNLTEEEQTPCLTFGGVSAIRDVWAKEDLPAAEALPLSMMPHTVRVFKTEKKVDTVEM